jgi:hypothetical protein
MLAIAINAHPQHDVTMLPLAPGACVTTPQVPGTSQEALYVTGRVAGPAGAQIMLELRLTVGQPGKSDHLAQACAGQSGLC